MTLYMLIVDDEPLMRRGIASALDWDSYGIQEVASAPNGRVALQMIEERQPDLILTDVRMPGIDGLELSRLVKERWSHIRIIIISGFDDFSYAKKSISYGVTDYILKPIDSKALAPTIQKAVTDIVNERYKLQQQTQMTERLRQTVGIARQKVLKDVLFGEADTFELSRYERVLGLEDIAQCSTAVVIVKIRSFQEKSMRFRDGGLLQYAVQNILDELLRGERFGELVNERLGRLCIVIKSGGAGTPQIEEFVVKAQGILHQYLRVNTTWAIGGFYEGVKGLRTSYREAVSALKMRLFMQSSCLTVADIPEKCSRIPIPNAELLEAMLAALRMGNTNSFQENLTDHIAFLSTKEEFDPDSIEMYFTEMASLMTALVKESGTQGKVDYVEQVREALYLSDTLEDIQGSMTELFRQACNIILSNQRKPYSKVIRDVIDYLQDHYKSEISLADAAGHVDLNRSYLSFLFVQETGYNFSDYLQNIRLDKAKELLRTTAMKNYEVAEAVGYSDFRYFGQIFKKHVGMTPGEYRKLAP